jgi:predicted HAD superfamily Cof-like phosphohydrolase
MSDEARKVYEFHRVMGLPTKASPEMPDEAVRHLRCVLQLEETLEFIAACGMRVWADSAGSLRVTVDRRRPPNLAAMAHENADLRYISHGNDLAMGVDGGAVFALIHDANMRKAPGGVPTIVNGKVVKPEGWHPADVAAEIRRQQEDEP